MDRLRDDTSQRSGIRRIEGGSQQRVFIPTTNGPPPPDDLGDADGIMDWLDGRGIINLQLTKVKEMVERAHKLELKGKGTDDDIIDIG